MFAGSHTSKAPSSSGARIMSPRPGVAKREACPRRRGDAVALHPVAGQLLGADLAEGGDPGLGRAVVGLPRVGEQPRRRRRVHEVARLRDAGLVLLPPVGRRPAGRGEVALEVDVDDGVPLLLGHVDDDSIAQDAGVVDEDVEVAEGLDGRVHEALRALPRRDAVAVRDGLPAHGDDLVRHLLGRGAVAAGAVGGAAEVVHDDLRSLPGEQQRVLAADAAPGPRDDRYPSVQCTHRARPPFVRGRTLTVRVRCGQGAGPGRATGSGTAGAPPPSPAARSCRRQGSRRGPASWDRR